MAHRTSLLLAALLFAPCVASAQVVSSGLPRTFVGEDRIRQGDAAHAGWRPEDALALYEEVIAEDPSRYDALWRAAREAVNLGMLAQDGDARKYWSEEAERYARQAREVNPAGVEGAQWLSIALGRLALEHGPKTRVRLATEMREVALHALSLDSTNAAAHHVLGEWNAEIRRLSGLERWAARKLLGAGVFGEASWDAAQHYLERAVELAPGGLIHHLDLARTYRDLDRDADAERSLRQVLARPAVEPVDSLHKEAARVLLEGRRAP